MTGAGYQYNLRGDLLPVPRELYSDRYLPQPSFLINSPTGETLSAIRYLPWQDGGVVLLRGKLPLLGILPFLGNVHLKNVGVVQPSDDLQISHVMPVTSSDFHDMLRRLQQQSNMSVNSEESRWVIQKLADEGSTSPHIARLLLGILRLRDLVYSDEAARLQFDRVFELVYVPLLDARSEAKQVRDIWSEHMRKVAAGEIARLRGTSIQIDESVDRPLRKHIENCVGAGARSIKQGMQQLAEELGMDIRFLFKKDSAFQKGLSELQSSDPQLAAYLQETRRWSGRLFEIRNDLEHNGWLLPKARYERAGTVVSAIEPRVFDQPVTLLAAEFVDRLCCFVEDVTAHGIQRRLPAALTLAEIPRADRAIEAPQRFVVTISDGGLPRWNISYHQALFEET